jgi:hypothetical protein
MAAAVTRARASSRREPVLEHEVGANEGLVRRGDEADERDRIADNRDRTADKRDRVADRRERVADAADGAADEGARDHRPREV